MFRRGAARVSPDPWGLPADDDTYQLEDVELHPPPAPIYSAQLCRLSNPVQLTGLGTWSVVRPSLL